MHELHFEKARKDAFPYIVGFLIQEVKNRMNLLLHPFDHS